MPHLAHVIALRPTPDQEALFRKAAGCARLAYNWALSHWMEIYRAGGKPRWMELQKTFIAGVDRDFPFLREVPSAVYYQPFRHLHQAFQRFFKKLGDHPTFKRKHGSSKSFKVGRVRCQDRIVVIPVIGAVRMCEALRFSGRVVSATVRARADRWEISILCEVSTSEFHREQPPRAASVGVDLGIANLATLSDGTVIPSPKPLHRHLKRLRRLSRRLSRRQKGSKRHARARAAVGRLHHRIRSIRQETLHTLTTTLVRDHQTIVIEDLNVRGMQANSRMARAIGDVGWHDLRRLITYKSQRYRRTLITANRFFPSSKTCSQCGHVLTQLGLSQRVFTCPVCQYSENRDVNAAINLNNLASRSINAHREHTVVVLEGDLQSCPPR